MSLLVYILIVFAVYVLTLTLYSSDSGNAACQSDHTEVG